MATTSYPLDLAAGATGSAINAAKLATAQLPGYMTSMANIGNKIARETAGEVPSDVINLLQQQGAERNSVTGAGSNAAYLRSLGLTSLGLMDQGQKDLESILPATPGYNLSQNAEFQTSAPLAYEKDIQQQIFQRQDVQQGLERDMQREALAAAKSGLQYGGGWSNPTNAWSGGGVDAFGFPNTTTATLPGQTSASGYTVPYAPGPTVAYGPGGGPDAMSYNDFYGDQDSGWF